MKLKIRYENTITTIDLPDDADYTLMLDADYEMRYEEAEPDKKKEVKRCNTVQEMFDLINKNEYNNWHQFDRYRGNPKMPYRKDDGAKDETDVMDKIGDYSDIQKLDKQFEYEALYEKIRQALKPDYAEMIIAIHIGGMQVKEYAALIGEKPNTVSKRLQRAEKKFRSIFSKTSFLDSSQGYEVEGDSSNKIREDF